MRIGQVVDVALFPPPNRPTSSNPSVLMPDGTKPFPLKCTLPRPYCTSPEYIFLAKAHGTARITQTGWDLVITIVVD